MIKRTVKNVIIVFFFILFSYFFAYYTSAAFHYSQRSAQETQRFETLNVVVPDFPAEGLILDIGGGGEGVIGQLKKSQVIAVDILKRELEEAPAGPLLKIVMDGRDLKFLDQSFQTTTLFFTFMYIAPQDHEKVFSEVMRVLSPGGRFLIWDAVFPKQTKDIKKYALFPLIITLPNRVIRTGYGVNYPENGQGIDHFKELAQKTGFKIVTEQEGNNWFFLELKKSEI